MVKKQLFIDLKLAVTNLLWDVNAKATFKFVMPTYNITFLNLIFLRPITVTYQQTLW